MTTSFQTIRLIGYLIVSLLFGIIITAIVGSFGNNVIERNVKRDTERQIKNAVKSFVDADSNETPDEIVHFLREYLSSVMKDKAVGIDQEQGDRVPPENEALFLFPFVEHSKHINIYIKRSYLEKEMFELDKPLVVEGGLATLVMFTLLVVFLEQRRQVQLKHQSEKAALNRELEEQYALALLGRMTATLAHELKTPIATLSNLVYALPSRVADPHFANRFVVLAKEEIDRTQQLIDNLLFYGRDIGSTNAEWVPLVDFVGGLAQKAGLHLDCASAIIYGDRFYLGLLFENLIRNSIQAQAKKIVMKTNAGKEVVDIHYEDDGLGFPAHIKLDELIKPFVTLRSRGAGLGLYLVRKILVAHEGELSLYRKEHGAGIKLCMPSARVKTYDSTLS